MRIRLILPEPHRSASKPNTIEKELSGFKRGELARLNQQGYNIYFFPNYNSAPLAHPFLNGQDVDVWEYVFVDMDLKDGSHTRESFLSTLKSFELTPTRIVFSGHGIHAYWRVSDLSLDSYLALQKRLIRKFNTDDSVWKIAQLMRMPGFYNTKAADRNVWPLCEILEETKISYKIEHFDEHLSVLSDADAADIEKHKNKVFGLTPEADQHVMSGDLPEKFVAELEINPALKELFINPKDRSRADMRIANTLVRMSYTRDEIYAVLSNTSKGKERGDEYVLPLLDKVIETPLTPLDSDFTLVNAIATNELVKKQQQELIVEHKIKKEYRKTLREIELEKRTGVYSLKNTTELRKKHYLESIEIMDKSMLDRLFCITPKLTNLIPLEGIETILVAAETGKGKSTTVCNITYPLLEQGKKVLIVSTEERAEDLMLRLIAIKNGWNVNDQRSWLENQDMVLQRNSDIVALSENPNLMIVDNYTRGTDLTTGGEVLPLDLTNRDHFESLLESTIRDGFKYDLLLVDYISKIAGSNDSEAEWQTIYKTIKAIEEWCKKTFTPAIVFSQLKANNSENPQLFENRIPGAKKILTAVTCAVELVTDYEQQETTVICHKNRKYGKMFRHVLKFHKGKYVDIE